MPQPHESSQNPIDLNQNFLINQIAKGLATTTELIQSLSTELKDNAVELAIIKTDLTHVTEDVRTLSKILREGNGTAPVLTRIAILETTAQQLSTSLAGIENNKEKISLLVTKVTDLADTKKTDAEDKKSRRQTILAIITSIIALISAIVVALLT